MVKLSRIREVSPGGRMEWCVATSKYRCMGSGRSSKQMRKSQHCEGLRWMGKDFNHRLKILAEAHFGEHDKAKIRMTRRCLN